MKDFEISYLQKKDYLSVLYLDHSYLKYLFFSMRISYIMDMVLQWLSLQKPPRWSRGVMVITTAQFHATKSELRFYAGSNPPPGWK